VVPERHLQVGVRVVVADECRSERSRRPRVVLPFRQRLVGHEARLQDDPRRLADRLDLVAHGGHRPLDERHEAGGADPDGPAGG
jgi:hypothetical protein